MLKILTSGATLQEAISNAQAHALAAVTVGDEVPAFSQVSVDIASTAPGADGEEYRFAGSVTFSVTFPPFGVVVDHVGDVQAVHLPGVDLDGLTVQGESVSDLVASLAPPGEVAL